MILILGSDGILVFAKNLRYFHLCFAGRSVDGFLVDGNITTHDLDATCNLHQVTCKLFHPTRPHLRTRGTNFCINYMAICLIDCL